MIKLIIIAIYETLNQEMTPTEFQQNLLKRDRIWRYNSKWLCGITEDIINNKFIWNTYTYNERQVWYSLEYI